MKSGNNHLVILDFDGTIARTAEPSPNRIDVNAASRSAVGKIFGDEGLSFYDEVLGGLQNREPGELVAKMIDGLGWRGNGFTAKGATEYFVAAKLSELLGEISPLWPQLYPGVRGFFRAVESKTIPVDVAIVSSGHDEFIKKVFKAQDLTCPEILVTSDVMRDKEMPQRPRYKPNPYQLALAHMLWMDGRSDLLHLGKEGMVYVGDDPKKDGGVAERSRIPFIFVPFTANGFVLREDAGQVAVNDFREITAIFQRNADEMRNGKSMAEVLTGKKYEEIFSPVVEGRLYARMLAEQPSQRGIERR
ncbi:MAG: HAD family hydrolase [Candidatus Levyibacteriota bacterium]